MKIEVLTSISEIPYMDFSNKQIFVIDILRATTSITTAFMNGAKSIIPTSTINEAFSIYEKDVANQLLAGERNAVMIDGFHLDNSPFSFEKNIIDGKDIIFTTTNGTRAIKSPSDYEKLYVCSFLNLSACIEKAISNNLDIVIICAGTAGIFSLEDSLCAGIFIKKLNKIHSNLEINGDFSKAIFDLISFYKNNWHNEIKKTKHYINLKEKGFDNDLEYFIKEDITNIVPEFDGSKLIVSR